MVGCAVLDEDGRIFSGCNIEHRFRSHDIHAEVNAISSLIAGGGGKAVAILIAATRERFTPCGSCMDWIFEIGSSDCVVISERDPAIAGLRLTASELMPFYPY
jgi:cytidine deaminase